MKTQAANLITSARILCAVSLAFCPAFSLWFYVFYSLCGISDVLDGFIARRLKTASKLGAGLDTAADVVFAAIALCKLLRAVPVPLWLIIWTALIAVVKAGSMLFGILKHRRFIAVHSIWNKALGILLFMIPLLAGVLRAWQIEAPVFIAACLLASAAAVREAFLIYHGQSIE